MPSLFAENYFVHGPFLLALKITNEKLGLRNQALLCGTDTW